MALHSSNFDHLVGFTLERFQYVGIPLVVVLGVPKTFYKISSIIVKHVLLDLVEAYLQIDLDMEGRASVVL